MQLSVVIAIALLPRFARSASDADSEIVVQEERAQGSVAEITLERKDIGAFPSTSADDLLRAMPGLHERAQGGHGKAYQYFVRGFDAVHGADLAVTLDGIPLNEVAWCHWPLGARGLRTTGGLDARLDLLDQWEQDIEPGGTPWEDRIDATVCQGDLGAWAALGLDPWPWLRSEVGSHAEVEDLWAYIALLSRTLGHVDSEGHCQVDP